MNRDLHVRRRRMTVIELHPDTKVRSIVAEALRRALYWLKVAYEAETDPDEDAALGRAHKYMETVEKIIAYSSEGRTHDADTRG